jgi:response regulator RpfG family c-di-GMP phosphodiesterase
MNNKILCVDDEPNVLQGYKRTLRKDYDIHIAEGGETGLAMIASEGPFAVVVSDMRMPIMDGIQFLRRVKEVAPETVRVMLTGNSDQQTAMDAVNEGSIFRFLTKPCPPETLAITLGAALEQYRLITAEKQLLEETLKNSLQVMVDILSMVNPTAFSRSTRVKKLARDIADRIGVKNAWEVEIAAMLSQIGCITVPEEVLQKIACGAPLDNKEAGLYHRFPQTGGDLISRIPRMETVAEMVANQNRRINDEHGSGGDQADPATLGARILKVVLDFDKLINAGNSTSNAYSELTGRSGWYDQSVLNVLKDMVEIADVGFESMGLQVSELKPGMILDSPLLSLRGQMLLSAGQEVTMSLILRLMSFVEAGIIGDTIRVNVPIDQLQLQAA